MTGRKVDKFDKFDKFESEDFALRRELLHWDTLLLMEQPVVPTNSLVLKPWHVIRVRPYGRGRSPSGLPNEIGHSGDAW